MLGSNLESQQYRWGNDFGCSSGSREPSIGALIILIRNPLLRPLYYWGKHQSASPETHQYLRQSSFALVLEPPAFWLKRFRRHPFHPFPWGLGFRGFRMECFGIPCHSMQLPQNLQVAVSIKPYTTHLGGRGCRTPTKSQPNWTTKGTVNHQSSKP